MGQHLLTFAKCKYVGTESDVQAASPADRLCAPQTGGAGRPVAAQQDRPGDRGGAAGRH